MPAYPDSPWMLRGNHPDHFRSGQWAKLIGKAQDGPREVYVVEFDDGIRDFWVIDDPDNPYDWATENLVRAGIV